MRAQSCNIPPRSRVIHSVADADFADCYQLADPDPERSALDTYLAVVADTPGWMNALMALRNRVVQFVGLKHLGAMAARDVDKVASDYKIGDRVGIFSLLHAEQHEVLMQDNDRHLRVLVSLFKHTVNEQPMVSVSTVVHIHNRLGQAYMAVVGPVHKLIVPRMLGQVEKSARV